MAPHIRDMKALATALKLHSKFETIDRLADEWIEKGMREKRAEDFEEASERRKWYDLRDSWEKANRDLLNAVNKFRQETGFSPILRFAKGTDQMGETGKVFLGYDSPQARGYRILELTYPQWFEALQLPTEGKSEDEVYRLVPVERLSAEEEKSLREDFEKDLKEAGIEMTPDYSTRFLMTVDKRVTFNENVFRVDSLVEKIKREKAVRPVAAPPPPLPTPALPPKPLLEKQDILSILTIGVTWSWDSLRVELTQRGFDVYSVDGERRLRDVLGELIREGTVYEPRPQYYARTEVKPAPPEVKPEAPLPPAKFKVGDYVKTEHGAIGRVERVEQTKPPFVPGWFYHFRVISGPSYPTEAFEGQLELTTAPPLTASDIQQVQDYFFTQLGDAGVTSPIRFKADFDKTVDPSKSWEENFALMDALVERIVKEQAPAAKPVEREVKVKVKVEDEKELGQYSIHLYYDSFEVGFSLAMSTPSLKEYLDGGEDYIDFTEDLSMRDFSPEQVEEELKKLPAPFSSGLEIKVVWTPQNIEFTEQAKEWWDVYNKVYTRPELEAFDWERLKMIAKLKLVRIGQEKAETIASILGEAVPAAPIPPPPTAPPIKLPEKKGLTTADISRLQDLWNNTFFRALGRVPPNSASAFRVEVEKVRDKIYSEAEEQILRVAKDIVDEFLARQTVERAAPPRRAEVFRPLEEREGEGITPIARIPPAEVPPHPLEPEEMKFPRGPSSKEREALWRAFQYRMQEQGYNAFDYAREFDEYIMGTQFKDWNELLAKFKIFTDSIMEGKALPPLWQWRGIPIPVGLEGVLRKTPAERLQDVIVHFSSVVIRNARTRGIEPTLADLQTELSERGLIPPDMIITPTSPLYGEIKNALTAAYKRKDDWLTGISLDELDRFLET